MGNFGYPFFFIFPDMNREISRQVDFKAGFQNKLIGFGKKN